MRQIARFIAIGYFAVIAIAAALQFAGQAVSRNGSLYSTPSIFSLSQ